MAKAKFVIAHYRCTEPGCGQQGKSTRHGATPLPEKKMFCKTCRKHTVQKAKDNKKAAKK